MEKNSDFYIKYRILFPIEWPMNRIGPDDELTFVISRRWSARRRIGFIDSLSQRLRFFYGSLKILSHISGSSRGIV